MVDILVSDYNTLQQRVSKLLGVGTATFGYGQTVQSSALFSGNIIRAQQWDDLRLDIINVLIHQEGVTPQIRDIAVADLIDDTSADPKINYDLLLSKAEENKFNVAPSQSVVSTIDEKTFSSSWSVQAQNTCNLTFTNSNQARHFFNSGGQIRITANRSGGTATAQNTSWTSLLSTAGTQSFGANTDPFVNFYTLTNSYQTYYQIQSSAPYSFNKYRLEAKCNVADNSTGTATEVDIRVSLLDEYVDPGNTPDDNPNTTGLVDGNLVLDFEELKASGSLQPTGTFTITSPSFTVSNITAS